MPWCEPCGKYYSPNTLEPDGTCPEHHQVAEATDADAEKTRAPWHFWVLAIGVAVYLGWRLIQLVIWLLT